MPQLTWLPAEQEPFFPSTDTALSDPEGLLAIGGALTPNWLLTAYERGIFPWYSDNEPIMWWSPSPRMCLEPGTARVNRSLKKHYRRSTLQLTLNKDFKTVIEFCGDESLRNEGTWITDDMKQAYLRLNELGWAHSIEVWDSGALIGGLYGVGIDRTFFGESMFSLSSNASKYAFIALSELAKASSLALIDCQLHNPYLESLGAMPISKHQFESKLPKTRSQLFLNNEFDLTELVSRKMNE